MVYCLLQYHSDLPPTLDWLSPIERERLEQLVIPKRRNDWLLGRWTARKLVEELFQSSHFAIVAAPDGAPELAWSEERCTRQFDISLSISHCHGWAFCGLSQVSGLRIGVDIERIESHSPAFIDQFFTDPERAEVERYTGIERDLVASLIWSAKEAVLKALRLGLTVDTRRVNVTTGFPRYSHSLEFPLSRLWERACPEPAEGGTGGESRQLEHNEWLEAHATCDLLTPEQGLRLWWCIVDDRVLTAAAAYVKGGHRI